MHLLSIDDVSARLIAIINKILTNTFPRLCKSRIGLESNIEYIQWWKNTHTRPFAVFTDLLEVISNHYISDIALRVGDAAQLTDLGMMGYAMLTSPNLETAIRIACQSLDDANYPLRVSLKSDDVHAELVFTSRNSNMEISNQGRQLLDIGMLSAWRYCQSVMKNGPYVKPDKVLISTIGSASIESYREKFNCDVITSASHNAIRIESRLLRSALPTGNSQLLIDCNSHMRQLVRQNVCLNNQISHRVRRILYERPNDCAFNLLATAQALNLSRDQLRRELSQASGSFREIANDVRMELARQYLIASPISIKEIAYQLSYSEPNNFIRAFSSRHSCSPAAFRKKHHEVRM
jgi:AraC-like DNA-binding protein